MTTLEKATLAANILDEAKATDVKILEITEKTSLADYFVIATGTSNTHVKALSDEVDAKLSLQGVEPLRTEGYQSQSWIILDYDDVIIHVFDKPAREFYSLDRLWADAPEVAPELVEEVEEEA